VSVARNGTSHSLHSMAYGEPITQEAVADRVQWLRERMRRAPDVATMRNVESELAWLVTVETV
jgi:hypothetical protein